MSGLAVCLSIHPLHDRGHPILSIYKISSESDCCTSSRITGNYGTDHVGCQESITCGTMYRFSSRCQPLDGGAIHPTGQINSALQPLKLTQEIIAVRSHSCPINIAFIAFTPPILQLWTCNPMCVNKISPFLCSHMYWTIGQGRAQTH